MERRHFLVSTIGALGASASVFADTPSDKLRVAVIGMGGISTATDVVEFMLAGATAVQIGTASYWDPCATEKIVDELKSWCGNHEVARLADLIGGMILE